MAFERTFERMQVVPVRSPHAAGCVDAELVLPGFPGVGFKDDAGLESFL